MSEREARVQDLADKLERSLAVEVQLRDLIRMYTDEGVRQRQEIVSLRSQLEAAKLDSDRLDWIAMHWMRAWAAVIERERRGMTLRAAIDAARSEGKPESGEGR